MKSAYFAAVLTLGLTSLTAWAQNQPAMPSGGVLVAANGMTLYTFDKDKGGKSACNGACETYWPPYKASATDHPAAPYTIVTRSDGSQQWAYDGKPLYFFGRDTAKGDRKGEGFKGLWHTVKP